MISKKYLLEQMMSLDRRIEGLEWDLINIKDDLKNKSKKKSTKNKELYMKYLSNQKLWKVVKERGEYYYEIKLRGEIIDRIRIEEPTLSLLKRLNLC